MKIAVMMNPSPRQDKEVMQADQLLELLKEYPFDVVTFRNEDADALVEDLRAECSQGGIDAVFAVGGDSTVHMAVEAVIGTDIPVGIIAIGSCNDIAREFALPVHNVEASVNRTVDALFSGRSKTIDTIEITGTSRVSHAVSVLSIGFDAEINYLHHTHSTDTTLNFARTFFELVRAWQPYGVTIEADGKRSSGPVSLLSVANTRFYGRGISIAPKALPDDGKLDIVIGPAVSRGHLLTALPLANFGRATFTEELHTLQASHIRIIDAPDQGAKVPIAMADGVVIDELPFDVRCLPTSLKLLI